MYLIFRSSCVVFLYSFLLEGNLQALERSKNDRNVTSENLLENPDPYTEREPHFYSLETATLKKFGHRAEKTKIKKFLIPGDHPAKAPLDRIFSASRALYDFQSMIESGYDPAIPQHHTGIIVTRHPELRGYVIKAYLDIQEYHSEKPEQYFWMKRCKGARLIRKCIAEYNYGHLLKVPKKWIYPLPDEPSPPKNCIRKMYILVEEDMNIYDDETNLALWGSESVTKEHIKALYTIITKLSLHDCAKPANCPISRDGRIAFVDTQSYHKKRVAYRKLTYYLEPSNREYWLRLIKEGKK